MSLKSLVYKSKSSREFSMDATPGFPDLILSKFHLSRDFHPPTLLRESAVSQLLRMRPNWIERIYFEIVRCSFLSADVSLLCIKVLTTKTGSSQGTHGGILYQIHYLLLFIIVIKLKRKENREFFCAQHQVKIMHTRCKKCERLLL